jgi:uncharacterized protein
MAERFELPIFPLGTVLYPGGLLPLKVFEQRYVEMTKRCVRDGTGFGVCLIREGSEVGDPALPAMIGCTARIEQWEVPHPNLFEILARGEQRFRVLSTEVRALGLIVCEAQLLPPDDDTDAPEPLCRTVLADVVERVGADRFSGEILLDDARWVSYRLAEVLPLSTDIRQQLLEMSSAHERLAMLHDILIAAGIGQSS